MNTAIQFFGSTGKEKPFPWGNALWMDNVDDSIHVPYSTSLDFTGKSFTIVCWSLQPELSSVYQSLLLNWDGISLSGNQHWGHVLGASMPGIQTRIRTGGTQNYQWASSGAAIGSYAMGAWDFRAYQFDKDGVNGIPNAMNLLDSRINRNNSGVPNYNFWASSSVNDAVLYYSFLNKIWTFNGNAGNAGSRSKKYIDTVAFFDRALTNNEVEKIFNKGKGRLPTEIPNCVACYLFDESPGTAIVSSAQTPGSPASRIILDHSGNGNHAYATGYGAGSTDFVDHFTLT